MEKISNREALKIAYENLYSCPIKKIDRNLDHLLQVKKIISLENGNKSISKSRKKSFKRVKSQSKKER